MNGDRALLPNVEGDADRLTVLRLVNASDVDVAELYQLLDVPANIDLRGDSKIWLVVDIPDYMGRVQHRPAGGNTSELR